MTGNPTRVFTVSHTRERLEPPVAVAKPRCYVAHIGETLATAVLALRNLLAKRKWIVWVAFVLVLVIAYWVGITLFLPKHDLNTLRQYEEAPNELHQLPPRTTGSAH